MSNAQFGKEIGTRMRMFEVPVKLASSVAPARTEELSERLGAGVFSRLPFELADGRRLERDVTQY